VGPSNGTRSALTRFRELLRALFGGAAGAEAVVNGIMGLGAEAGLLTSARVSGFRASQPVTTSHY
jgi:hypothetical protein